MRKPERRKNRSDKANVALDLFLDSIRKSEGIEAVAVSTEDGFLVAGAGANGTDIEWMGALGAASKRKTFEWEEHTLHVQKLEVNRVPMFLTCAGRATKAAAVKSGFERILAA